MSALTFDAVNLNPKNKDFMKDEMQKYGFSLLEINENELIIGGEYLNNTSEKIIIDTSDGFTVKKLLIVDADGKSLEIEVETKSEQLLMFQVCCKVLAEIEYEIIVSEEAISNQIKTLINNYFDIYMLQEQEKVQMTMYCFGKTAQGFDLGKYKDYISLFDKLENGVYIRFKNGILIYNLRNLFQIGYKTSDNILITTTSPKVFNKALDILFSISLKNSIHEFGDRLKMELLNDVGIKLSHHHSKRTYLIEDTEVKFIYKNKAGVLVVISLNDNDCSITINNAPCKKMANIFDVADMYEKAKDELKIIGGGGSPTLMALFGSKAEPAFNDIINRAEEMCKIDEKPSNNESSISKAFQNLKL